MGSGEGCMMARHLQDEQVKAVMSTAGVDVTALSEVTRIELERVLDEIFENGYEAGHTDAVQT